MPTSRTLLLTAMSVAITAHHDQVDKAGQPYLLHPLRVATRLADAGATDTVVAAALLHDALEDSTLTSVDLTAEGIPTDVTTIVLAMTRRPGVTYQEYLEVVAANPGARQVKLADLADNTDPDRLNQLPQETQVRLAHKYAGAYQLLGVPVPDDLTSRIAAVNPQQ